MKELNRIIPKQKCEEWPVRLNKIVELVATLEYQTVKRKIRRISTVCVNPDNLPQQIERFNEDGLVFLPFKKLSSFQGYQSLQKPAEPGEPFVWYGCLARTKEDTQRFKKAFLKNDHKTMGKLLGYPDCCVNSFIKNFYLDPVPIWKNLEKTITRVRGYPECNMLLVYFGARIVPYISCSPTCKATKGIGEVWLEIMQEINKDLTDELYKLLAGPIIWNSYHGVIQVETPYFVGLNNGISYLKKPKIFRWRGIKQKISSRRKTELKGY